TLYADHGNVHLCAARYGEDAAKVVDAFRREHAGTFVSDDFGVAPIFAYGLPPRKALCTKQSLAAAFQNLPLQPGGSIGEEWMALLRHFGITVNALVPWPKAEIIQLEAFREPEHVR